MGEIKQLTKRQLQIQLGKLKILPTPHLGLEQYPVSPETASELLYMAGFEHDDLDGRVIDLGTGTGHLAIGAALMGSKEVTGVEVDERAIALARENARAAHVQVDWVLSDISAIAGDYDTAIMNPPYGTRRVHADVGFLQKAFDLTPTVYSIHKRSTRDYLLGFVKNFNYRVDQVRTMKMQIPHLFSFHRMKWKSVEVDLCRIVSQLNH